MVKCHHFTQLLRYFQDALAVVVLDTEHCIHRQKTWSQMLLIHSALQQKNEIFVVWKPWLESGCSGHFCVRVQELIIISIPLCVTTFSVDSYLIFLNF